MGDRVSFCAYVKAGHVTEFCKHTEFSFADGTDRGNGWIEFKDDQLLGGAEAECKDAAEMGVDFFAEHGQHYMFPGAWMCGCNREFFIIHTPEWEGGGDPCVLIKRTGAGWDLDEEDVDYALRGLRFISEYAEEAGVSGFSGYTEELDFGEMLEARLDCLNNEAVINELNFGDPDNVSLLLDYIRVKIGRTIVGHVDSFDPDSDKVYEIRLVDGFYTCTCPDWVHRQAPDKACKHIVKFAADKSQS